MKRLDVYYRALRAYRGVTAERECGSFRRAVAASDTENDSLCVSRYICTVEEDWMDEIERGLVFVEKAIREERQFIHSNGEVVPIEKVKHVSRESVQHLARHSNLITKERVGEKMIPDRLYSVEKQNDYAVYENRFLYMLLCYLRDFITVRYDGILTLSHRYEGELQMKKSVPLPNRRLSFAVSLRDEREDDAYLREHNPARRAIERIDTMLGAVNNLISTPLMEIAGKAPRLKPPITKTNVLRMDNNFKGAVALYEYLAAYEGDGYTVRKSETELAPFREALADELAEACGILTFLTYAHGLSLNETLKNRLREREEREREEALLRSSRKLALVKKKLESGELGAEAYIAELEEHLRALENDNRGMQSMRRRVAELTAKEERARGELLALTEANESLRGRIKETELLAEREKEAVRAECEARIRTEISRKDGEMSALRGECEKRLRENEERFALEKKEVCDQLLAEREALCAFEEKYAGDMRAAEKTISEKEERIREVVRERDGAMDRNLVCEARIKALRAVNGEKFDETAFTEMEDFNELERELEAFVRFYDERWGIAKRAIRKKLLGYQSLKGRNGRK